jgi:hypothetical protein
MPGIVLTLPILAGKVEAWRRFCQELSHSRRQMYETSRRRLGITHERLALVESAYGATAVTVLETPDVEQALCKIVTSTLPFDNWYREQILEIFGITRAGDEQFVLQAAQAPEHELLFEWTCDPERDAGPHERRDAD